MSKRSPTSGRPGRARSRALGAPEISQADMFAWAAAVAGLLSVLFYAVAPVAVVLGLAAAGCGVAAMKFQTNSRAPALAGGVLGVLGVLLSLGMHFGLDSAQEGTNRTVCQAQMRGLAKVMTIHLIKKAGVYPVDLAQLAREMPSETIATECPSDQSGRTGDYFYFPPDRLPASSYVLGEGEEEPSRKAPREAFVMCDFRSNHGDVRNVLYVDGTVLLMTEEDFQQELKKPDNVAFRIALTKAEGP